MNIKLLWLFLSLLFIGCAPKHPKTVVTLPSQDIAVYLKDYNGDKHFEKEGYTTNYFRSFRYAKAPLDVARALWPYSSYTKGTMYGATLQKIAPSFFADMYNYSNFENYDTLRRYALSNKAASMRNFPSDKPLFRDPKRAGEGYPFDYNQNTLIRPMEPLYLSHYSKDGAWVFAFSSYAAGWLRASDVKTVTREDVERLLHAQSLFVVKDDLALFDVSGRYVNGVGVGVLLPIVKEQKNSYLVLLLDGTSRYRVAEIAKDAVAYKPLALNRENMRRIIEELQSKPYGWGGMYGDRDCSSMLRDLYVPFGIYLPRNSAAQARSGKVVSLAGLSEKQKIEKIKKEAIPFETLLYKKGHIMLYLGVVNGRVMVFHDMWGVKTRKNGEEGRYIIAKSVVTPLRIAYKTGACEKRYDMLRQLQSFVIVTAK